MTINIQPAITAGLQQFRVREPLTGAEWADRYFYLSPESSGIEGRWRTYPYQVSLLTDALLKAGAIIIPILDSLPLVIKRYWPEVTGDQVTEIKRAVAECRNAIADMRIDVDA